MVIDVKSFSSFVVDRSSSNSYGDAAAPYMSICCKNGFGTVEYFGGRHLA